MGSDPFQRVRAGEQLKISASGMNDILKQAANKKHQGDKPSPLIGGGAHVERFEVLIMNPTAGSTPGNWGAPATYGQNDVVSLAKPLMAAADDDELARADFDRRKVMIGVQPVPT